MATCTDCFNYDLCKIVSDNYCELTGLTENISDVEKFCTFFKDKSKIIELPCKVGDTVYMVGIERIIPIKVNDIDIKKNFLTNDFDIILFGEGIFDGKKCDLNITWKKRYQKDVFLTLEEAEKALEKLKSN